MVDPWGFIKNVLDAHGAWILGGAIVANLAHTANKKSKSFKRAVEWNYVQCIGCGRGGYSDEMRSSQDSSGKNHFSCARCSRPDLFKQAESDHPQPTTDWQESGILTHSYPTKDPGYDHDNQLLYYLDWDSEDPYPTLPCIYCRTNLELFRVEKKISWDGKPYEHLIYKCNPCCLSTKSAEGDGSKPCSHCDGTASFPREFYYQADRIEMVPCGTCITQGRCPGCMEIYPNLSRSNQPEDVFLGSGCERCGYTEADARAARKTARRWADLVDNPAAAKFMAEGDFDEEDMVHCNHCSEIVGNEQEVYGDETVDYEVANGELVCVTCYKIWMEEYKNDLDPHYTPFYAEGDAPKVSPKASIQSFVDYEEQRTSNSPCDCHVCVDREPDDETKCYVCENRYPFKTMVMSHGIEGVEANCKGCFTNAQTVTSHCPTCGGLSCGQQYGIPPYGFPMDEDGIYTTGTPYFLPISYTEDCEGWCESMSAEDSSIDDDYYQLKNHECPLCKSMVTESDSCGDQCGQCWSCGCDCDAILATQIITEDDHDYEVDDYILIVDGSIREVSGNSEMEYLESNSDWDQYQIAIITGVKPYVVEIANARYGNQTRSAESYDLATHGKPLPLGSVKRFLTKIPRSQMFHVDFVKSNGDIRSMDAFFNKPYQPDSNTANVMEVTGSGKAGFKRFRVDRVVSIWIV